MCWRNLNINGVLIKDEPVCQIAETNIQVYKVMALKHGRLLSYFRNVPYKVSDEYSLEETGDKLTVNYDKNGHLYIDIGFHAYTNKCHLMINKFRNVEVKCADFFIQSYIVNHFTEEHVLAKCIIPKGSKYYVNGVGEVVSDRIIIKNYASLRTLIDCNECKIFEFDDVPMLFSES